jgi:hypothetical protein
LQRDIVAALDRVEVVDLPRRLAAMCIVPQPAAPTPAPEPTEA